MNKWLTRQNIIGGLITSALMLAIALFVFIGYQSGYNAGQKAVISDYEFHFEGNNEVQRMHITNGYVEVKANDNCVIFKIVNGEDSCESNP